MKKSVCFILIIILSLSLTAVASADVYDGAELLSESEFASLDDRSEQLSGRYGCDVLIYTEYSYSTASYAVREMSDADSCVIFYVSMADNNWTVHTTGDAWDMFNDAAMDEIENTAVPHLQDGEYYEAFDAYLDVANDVLYANSQGKAYERPKKLSSLFMGLGISAVIALVIAFVWVSILKGQLTSVRFQHGAAQYKKAGSFNLTSSNDVFLYKNVTRVARPKSNGSSGGRGGGSRSGKF